MTDYVNGVAKSDCDEMPKELHIGAECKKLGAGFETWTTPALDRELIPFWHESSPAHRRALEVLAKPRVEAAIKELREKRNELAGYATPANGESKLLSDCDAMPKGDNICLKLPLDFELWTPAQFATALENQWFERAKENREAIMPQVGELLAPRVQALREKREELLAK